MNQLSKSACFTRIANHNFALPDVFIRQVIDRPHVTPVPRSGDLLDGVFASQGGIYPLVNSSVALGLDASQDNEIAIIVEFDDKQFGLSAQSILGFTQYAQEDVRSLDEHPFAKYIVGQADYDNQPSFVLDVPQFLEDVSNQLSVS